MLWSDEVLTGVALLKQDRDELRNQRDEAVGLLHDAWGYVPSGQLADQIHCLPART